MATYVGNVNNHSVYPSAVLGPSAVHQDGVDMDTECVIQLKSGKVFFAKINTANEITAWHEAKLYSESSKYSIQGNDLSLYINSLTQNWGTTLKQWLSSSSESEIDGGGHSRMHSENKESKEIEKLKLAFSRQIETYDEVIGKLEAQNKALAKAVKEGFLIIQELVPADQLTRMANDPTVKSPKP